MNEIEKSIWKFNWLPYKLGQIVPSQAKFNKGQPCRIFKIYGSNRINGNGWDVNVYAGIVDKDGIEIEGSVIVWKSRHDQKLTNLINNLTKYFPYSKMHFQFYISKVQEYESEFSKT